MKKIDHEIDGRKYKILLPTGSEDPDLGIMIGPPAFVDELGLPEPFATRLHNQMFDRGLLTLADVQRKSREIQAALQSAFRVDAARIIDAYNKAEKETLPFE